MLQLRHRRSASIRSLLGFAGLSLAAVFAVGLWAHGRLAADAQRQGLTREREAPAYLAGLARVDSPAVFRSRLQKFAALDRDAIVYRQHDGATLAIGRRFALDAALMARARAGRAGATIVRRGGTIDRVRFYEPVAGGGVLVLDRDGGRLAGELRALRDRFASICGVGLAFLWLVLLPIFWNQSRRLRRMAERSERMAREDELTQLPNRRALQAALRAHGEQRPLAVALIDVDGFKGINAELGQLGGDEVLRETAARLAGTAPEGAFVARMGGDEFALVVDTDHHAAATAVERMCASCVRPTVSAGVAIGVGGSDLLGRAAAALVRAKEGRPGSVVVHAADDDELVLAPAEQRRCIEELLANPERIAIKMQPVVELGGGRVIAYEALSRFDDGRVPPDVWFARAQRVGLGPQLEALALRRALAAEGRPAGTLSLNVSPSSLAHPAVQTALPDDLRGIVLELTEHELAADGEELLRLLGQLRARGARIAVDDTGAGYAGLTHLLRLAPDLLKLDRELVRGVDADPVRQALIRSFVRFALDTGVQLCVEGVETLSELRTLASLDVRCAQGYAFAAPGAGWPEPAADAVAACRDATEQALAGAGAGGASLGLAEFETLAQRLAEATSVDDLAGLAPSAAATMDADSIALSLWVEREDAVLTLGASDWRRTEERFRLDDYPATRRALRERRAVEVVASDPNADPSELAYLATTGFRSALLVPIVTNGRSVALLEAYMRRDRSWGRSQIARARLLCSLIGGVLERFDMLAENTAEPKSDPAGRLSAG